MLLGGSSFAVDTIEQRVESAILQTAEQDSNTDNLVIISEDRKVVKPFTESRDTFEDVIIAQILSRSFAVNNAYIPAKELAVVDVVSIENTRILIDLNNSNKSESIDNENVFNQQIHLTGLCTIPKPIAIKLMPSYATVKCYFETNEYKISTADMLINVVPYAKFEAIIGQSISFETEDLNTNGGKERFNVLKGVIMTPDMTSLNIASYFNSNAFAKSFTKEAINTNNEVYRLSTSYLDALQASKVTQEITYQTSALEGTTPIQSTNTERPELGSYIALAGIKLVTGAINTVLDYEYSKSSSVWSIYQNSQIYVDIVAQHSSQKNSNFSYRVKESMDSALNSRASENRPLPQTAQ